MSVVGNFLRRHRYVTRSGEAGGCLILSRIRDTGTDAGQDTGIGSEVKFVDNPATPVQDSRPPHGRSPDLCVGTADRWKSALRRN
ncbi:protein of unknown function [Pararobbsia alpina]